MCCPRFGKRKLEEITSSQVLALREKIKAGPDVLYRSNETRRPDHLIGLRAHLNARTAWVTARRTG
jgi:hypothetical protein